MSSKRHWILATVSAFGLSAAGLNALAQVDAPEDGEDAVRVIDTVVVTSQKRASTVQKTAAAVTALNSEALQQRNITDASELTGQIPNVQIGSIHRELAVSIRGVSSANVPPAQDSSVGIHYDGVYLPRPSGANSAFFDLERVEVLRGPQGTLYGRNTTGGAINLITRKPVYESEGAVEVSVGNYNAFGAQGMMNIPLVDDKIAFRAAFSASRHDGYQENVALGGPDLADLEQIAGRVHLLVEPTDRLKMLFSGNYYRRGGAGNGQTNISLPGFDPYQTNSNTPYSTDNLSLGLVSDITYSFEDFDFVSLSSYREDTVDVTFDIAPGIPNTGSVRLWNPNESISQEFRLVSTWDKPISYVLGAYYMDEQNADNLDLYFNFEQTAGFIQRLPDVDAKTVAAFAQVDLQLNDWFKVFGGVRYSEDEKHVLNGTQDFIGGPVNTFEDLRGEWSKTTWKAGAQIEPTETNMLYASVSTGYKAGGVGPINNFDPENVVAYEVGSKNRLFGGRVVLNLAAFLYEYDDLQLTSIVNTGTNVVGIISNAAAAENYGFELESNIQVTDSMRVDFSASYLNSEFTSFPEAFDSVNGVVVDVTGNRLPRAPEMQATLGIEKVFEVSSGDLIARVDGSYSSDIYFSEFNDTAYNVGGTLARPYELAYQDDYTLVNLKLRYEHDASDWYAESYIRNATEEDVIGYASVGGSGTIAGYLPPRTFGVRVGTRY